jgi:RNA polymerase sigma-70 factor, ECF subfamily
MSRMRSQSRGRDRTDAEVVRASWTDPAEFGEIFDRHFEAIFGYLARRASRDEAADLANETFRLAFAARQRFDPSRESARPWLYGFATNVFRHHLRSRGRQDRTFQRAATATASPTSLDIDRAVARIDAERVWPRVAIALAALPADEADALILLAWEGLTYTAIATATGVPVGTVRSRINRARSRLRELIDADGQPRSEDHPPRVQEVSDHG